MLSPDPSSDPRSTVAGATASPSGPIPAASGAPASTTWPEPLLRSEPSPGLGDPSLRPWSQPVGGRAGAHLSTGLRSPLSWLIYLLLAAALVVWLRPFWREALLAFACTALAGALWILAANRRGMPRDDEALLARIDGMAGLDFEAWIVDRLAAGGLAVRNVRDSGDFGVDIITWRHGLAIGLQPKRYHGKVGNDAIQQVLAGCDYHGCQLAVVLTQSSFTAPAREQAEKARHPVVLIERAQLLDFVEVLDVAAADPSIRRRILRQRSLAVHGRVQREDGPDPITGVDDDDASSLDTLVSSQEAAEDLVAQRYALGAEAQR